MTTRPLIVPVDLGGTSHPWLLRPPLRPAPQPDVVAALVQHYRAERRQHPDQPLEVAFFHGGLPSDAALEAAGPGPKRLACLPGDLSPTTLSHLVARGVSTIELDVGTAHTAVRRGVGRRLTRGALERMIHGLSDRNLRVGVVLSPGLPGSSHDGAVEDAAWVVSLGGVRFVRLLPALAWRGSPAEQLVADGRWQPMRVSEAVTSLEVMMDVLEAGAVEVARVGLQPGPDLGGTVVAGPVHPNLRALVQYRRFRRKLRVALEWMPRARVAVVRVHPADLSWARGQANANVRALRSELRLRELQVRPDPSVSRGTVQPGAGEE